MPAPVVVVKDVGGLVRAYQDRTELYRAQNREVRLHECRSACTLALSLPNVCVYPTSQLKFHQAYNDLTKEVDLGVTNELWGAYPPSVRERLQFLTRQYKVIRGSELIAMGFRNCNGPAREPKIMVAKARPREIPASGDLFAGVQGAVSGLFSENTPQPGARPPTPRPSATPGRDLPPATPPTPPARPGETTPDNSLKGTVEVPMPPVRPPLIGALTPLPAPPLPPSTPAWLRPIKGSAPILEARFISLKDALRKLTSTQ